jgi:hypothetical protein
MALSHVMSSGFCLKFVSFFHDRTGYDHIHASGFQLPITTDHPLFVTATTKIVKSQ